MFPVVAKVITGEQRANDREVVAFGLMAVIMPCRWLSMRQVRAEVNSKWNRDDLRVIALFCQLNRVYGCQSVGIVFLDVAAPNINLCNTTLILRQNYPNPE
jgi:hypothetical protein